MQELSVASRTENNLRLVCGKCNITTWWLENSIMFHCRDLGHRSRSLTSAHAGFAKLLSKTESSLRPTWSNVSWWTYCTRYKTYFVLIVCLLSFPHDILVLSNVLIQGYDGEVLKYFGTDLKSKMCGKCNVRIGSRSDLRKHIAHCCNTPKKRQCMWCTEKPFSTKSCYKAHLDNCTVSFSFLAIFFAKCFKFSK